MIEFWNWLIEKSFVDVVGAALSLAVGLVIVGMGVESLVKSVIRGFRGQKDD